MFLWFKIDFRAVVAIWKTVCVLYDLIEYIQSKYIFTGNEFQGTWEVAVFVESIESGDLSVHPQRAEGPLSPLFVSHYYKTLYEAILFISTV